MSEPLKVVVYGGRLSVSRADLLDAGAVEPTDEERVTLEAYHREWECRRRVEREAVAALTEALKSVADPVARAVLDLHKADGGICAAERDEYSRGPEWPCQTVETVATTLGIPFPPHMAY